ncbi:MAG: site-specific DNA-methyltransferase [Treponema sp.]|nr:site-specific DNA-methyltransferase [Treponema sp.]
MEKEQYEAQIKALKEEIELLKKKQTYEIKRQKYGLNWIDVPEAFEKDSENKIPVLEEVKEKSIKNDDGKPTHILIEGDNYHALQCLNYTHKGKVDVIYIDPPYNTGKEFRYNDVRFIKEYPDGTPVSINSPLRHSYWLSFMKKRLILAKNVLAKNGILFVSLDDNELANLKILCDSIFLEQNFLGILVQNKGNAQNDAKNIQKNHDYVLVYANNRKYENGKEQHIICTDNEELKEVFLDSENNQYYYKGAGIVTGGEGGTLNARENLGWSIYYREETNDAIGISDYNIELAKTSNTEKDVYKDNVELLNKGYKIIRPPKKGNKLGCWTWSLEKFNREKNHILINKTTNGYSVIKKEYVSSDEVFELDTKKFIKIKGLRNIKSIHNYSSSAGTTLLNDILGSKEFENPKNLNFIQFLIKSIHNKSSTILDFFAGSGTTLHATMKLNEEDGGNRQCILVQLNENNICEEVTYERNHRVMQGYTNSKGEQIPGLGNSLKYYKTAFIGQNNCKNANDDDRTELAKKAGCLLSLGENTLDEICSTEYYQLFTGSKEATAVYFTDDYEKFDEFKEKVAELATKYKKTFVYIFAWSSADDFAYEFEDVPNIQIKAIPLPILEIYKSIYNA